MRTAAPLLLALVAGLAGAPQALAANDDVDRRLTTVERALKEGLRRERELESEAAAIESGIVALRAELVTAARAVQNHEQRLIAIEQRLADLTRTEAEKVAALSRRREALTATLGALERLGRQPPEVLIAAAATMTDMIRASLLLRAIVPALDDEARALRHEVDGLSSLRRTIAAEHTRITTARARLAAERRRVGALLERRSALRRTTMAKRRLAEQRVARLGTEAKDLRGLIERLGAEKAAPAPGRRPLAYAPPRLAPGEGADAAAAVPKASRRARAATGSFRAARGTLPMPVRGRLVARFGEPAESGGLGKGITIEARAGAQVITPFDGQVVFAGPFRGYGQLLIIEHGGGYHTLLAGFTRIDSALGQWLLAGEPVGVLGPGPKGKPRLYVELRRNGEAINPLPWLAASERKVGG